MPNKINWKSYWNKAKLHMVFSLVIALSIGIYGWHLYTDLPNVKEPPQNAVATMNEADRPPRQPTPTAAATSPQPLTAVSIQPTRVEMPLQDREAEVTTGNDTTAVAIKSEANVSVAPEEAAPSVEVTAKVPTLWQYRDPTALLDKGRPCTGDIVRGYGFVLDEQYGDYRYNNGLDFLVDDNRTIQTVLSGTVVEIDAWAARIVIESDEGLLTYQPLTDISVAQGQTVSGQHPIGNLPKGESIFRLTLQTKQSPQ